MLEDRLDLSQRRACAIAQQPRSTQRYKPRRRDEERRLVARLHELVRERPRAGHKTMTGLLRDEGWRVSRKRIHRLWRKEGFKVPKRSVRKRHLGDASAGIARHAATRPNDVWAWDFVHDRLEDGRAVKWLACVDEFTRECVLLEARRSIKAADAVALLAQAIAKRGAPAHLRSDNGPEFIARAIEAYVAKEKIATLYIEKGAPWQNGFAESFNARLRDELINVESFASVLEAQVIGGRWREDYNTRRPHSSLGWKSPAAYAASLVEDAAASTRATDKRADGVAALMDSPGKQKAASPACPQGLKNRANSRPVLHNSTAPAAAGGIQSTSTKNDEPMATPTGKLS